MRKSGLRRIPKREYPRKKPIRRSARIFGESPKRAENREISRTSGDGIKDSLDMETQGLHEEITILKEKKPD
ncbi:MAG: hypothetical protein M0041_00350 [Nitrospiraceae bacterium]|nr:hypothetical protein [Nitrospiraceae bacterium]